MNPGEVFYAGYTREMALRSVGPGWATLVNRVFDSLPTGTHVIQVKEKLGALTIYTTKDSVGRDDFDRLLATVWDESKGVCQRCGAPGFHRSGGPHVFLGTTGLVRTLCDTCEADYQATGVAESWL